LSSRSRSRAWFFSFRPVPVPPDTGHNCEVWRYGNVGLSLEVLQPAPVLISLDLAASKPFGEEILRPVHRGGVIPPWALPPNQEANDEEDHSDPEQENQGPENTRSTGSGMCHRCQRKDVHG